MKRCQKENNLIIQKCTISTTSTNILYSKLRLEPCVYPQPSSPSLATPYVSSHHYLMLTYTVYVVWAIFCAYSGYSVRIRA